MLKYAFYDQLPTMEWHCFDFSTDLQFATDAPEHTESSFHIVISDAGILCINEPAPWRPLTQDEYRWLGTDEISSHYLGNLGGIPIYANEVAAAADNPPGYDFASLWSLLGKTGERVFHLIGRAKQIIAWYRNHQFCGQCGQPTGEAAPDRSRKCNHCGQMFYPRLSPSIIVLVSRGEEILLAKNANARGDFYSTLAGFIEPGESIEAAVHREVMEEVGIRVKNLQYYRSQPWPFPNSLMLGFHAQYASGDITLQAAEIADAQWFHYTKMPHRPAMVSISGWLIDDYIQRLAASS